MDLVNDKTKSTIFLQNGSTLALKKADSNNAPEV
jgi:hypothetical protein